MSSLDPPNQSDVNRIPQRFGHNSVSCRYPV
jgi:hypothetical protein